MSAQRQKRKQKQKLSQEQIQAYKTVVAQRADMYDPKLDEDQPVEEFDENDSPDYDDCGDGDATQYSQSGDQDPIHSSYIELREKDSVLDTPILNFERLYTIAINRWPDGIYRCRYEPTKNLRSANRPELSEWIKSINKLLNLTSDWLEKTHPEFLKHPIPENFVYQGTFTQNSFLKELYQSEQKSTLDSTKFSGIINSIWLLWDDKCLPLKALFSFGNRK